MTYQKIAFSDKTFGSTAGLVLPVEKVKYSTVSELSRYFGLREACKMTNLHISPEYRTWDAAFAHEFADLGEHQSIFEVTT